MTRIMEGIRVLEAAAWTYVPMAGGVLAEWGADVLKVEHPETGDPQRGLITSGLLPGGATPVNFIIEHPNRGKRSVAIDLATDEGHELLLKLAATSDVFSTNFLPAARRKLRIEVEDIRTANPKIIYARGSGQGQRGPETERGGYDGCTFWARGGSADISHSPGAAYPPSQPGGAYGDTLGGLTIAGGIAAALFHRERTGEALTIDCSLVAMGAWATAFTISGAAAFGLDRFPVFSREQAANPIVNVYRTSDNRYLSLVMLQSDRYWPELMEKVGRPDLITNPRFADSKARAENKTECIHLLDEIFASRTFEEWKKVLADVEGIWSAVQTAGEVINDPVVVANSYVRDVKAEDGSTFKLVAVPLEFNETPSEITRAPNLGEHTDEVLLELGLDMDQVMDLKVKGAIL
jgi:crotonobetainyl-CoA:carnitine CoA-transferase CaiB-like acyl-CoA transferase